MEECIEEFKINNSTIHILVFNSGMVRSVSGSWNETKLLQANRNHEYFSSFSYKLCYGKLGVSLILLLLKQQKRDQLLTSQGINKAVTASLLDLAGASREIVQYIAGPIVTQQNGWQQSISTWVGKAIAVDRLDAALQEIDKGEVGKLASSSEVVALMMPIAFEVPLPSQWTDVYLWASYDALVRHRPFKNFNYENLWEKIGTTPVLYDKIRSDYETLALDSRAP